MNITEDKLKAGIQVALGTLGLYTQEAETLLIHHIKALTLTDVSQQRELLIADFIEKYNKGLRRSERIHEDFLEDYLQGNL